MKKIKKALCVLISAVILYSVCSPAVYAFEDGPIYRFAVLSDTHISKNDNDENFIKALELISSEKDTTDGLIIAGDITNHGEPQQIEDFYRMLDEYCTIENLAIATGNHDMGQLDPSGPCRANQIAGRNAALGMDSDKIYYSVDMGGIKVIILGDEGNGSNICKITNEQIDFLGNELASGAADGRPCFVICHWPLMWAHGNAILWPIVAPGGCLNISTSATIEKLMRQYKNTYYVSGHLHKGLKGNNPFIDFGSVVTQSGVKCINVPSLGENNRAGYKAQGQGMEFDIYRDKIVIRGRDYFTGNYLTDYVFEIALNDFDCSTLVDAAEQSGGLITSIASVIENTAA